MYLYINYGWTGLRYHKTTLVQSCYVLHINVVSITRTLGDWQLGLMDVDGEKFHPGAWYQNNIQSYQSHIQNLQEWVGDQVVDMAVLLSLVGW